MAIKFGDVNGKAKKGAESYKYKDGENTIRIFGEVVPRYIYWLKTADGKDIPFECLSFDRDKEKFTNKEVDWVRHYFPDLNCSWAYVVAGFSIADKKAVAINLKKKLFEQILNAAEDLGDPTDPVEGWNVVFKREKTGSLAFNVEYTLQVLRCKKRALTAEEQAIVANAPSIETLVPRPTADEQHALIKSLILNNADEEDVPEDAKEAASQDFDDDIPF